MSIRMSTARWLVSCAVAVVALASPQTVSAEREVDKRQQATGSAEQQGTRASGNEDTGSAQQQGTGSAQQRTPAQQPSRSKAGSPAPTAATLDVEELNDNVARYIGQTVSVAGEVQERFGPNAFVLESGGIFDDEITVVASKDAKGLASGDIAEDADVVVTGKVRAAAVVDFRRDVGWDLDPELEAEFEGTRPYIVAERITRQRDR